VGSAQVVGEQLQQTAATSGADYLMCSSHWGTLTHIEALRSLEFSRPRSCRRGRRPPSEFFWDRFKGRSSHQDGL
jgi:hypothetical protein